MQQMRVKRNSPIVSGGVGGDEEGEDEEAGSGELKEREGRMGRTTGGLLVTRG